MLPAIPCPVTRPIRPLISWIAAISGKVNSMTQHIEKPNCAPAWEYVAMPEGSSSDAPVIRPGPSAAQSPFPGGLRGARWTAIRAGEQMPCGMARMSAAHRSCLPPEN